MSRTQWIINVFDGIDKLGKTTGINAIEKVIKKQYPNAVVNLIQNPTTEQREILSKTLMDSPITDSAMYSAFITKNWVDYRDKNYISSIAQSGKKHIVLIDRWYSSTFAYQGTLAKTEPEMIVVERFSIDMVKDFLNELSIIAKFTPNLDIYFNFFLITTDDVEMVLQGQDTNTEPLSKKYERIEFLEKVNERFHLFVEMMEEISDIDTPDNLMVNIEVIDYQDFRSDLFLQNLVKAYITLANMSSTSNDNYNDSWAEIVAIIKEMFLPEHSIFVRDDLQAFCDSHFILLTESEIDELLKRLEHRNLISLYDTGVFKVYWSTIERE